MSNQNLPPQISRPSVDEPGALRHLTMTELLSKVAEAARERKLLIQYSVELDKQYFNLLQAIQTKHIELQDAAEGANKWETLARSAMQVIAEQKATMARSVEDINTVGERETVCLSQVSC
jgi:predicted transcriptional regulator